MSLSILLAATLAAAAPIPKDAPPTVVLGVRNPTKDKEKNLRILQAHARLLKNKRVLKPALLKPGVARVLPLGYKGDAVEWLAKRLETEIRKEDNTLRVWMREGGNRREQAALLNTLVEVYLEEEGKRRREPTEQIIQSLERWQQRHRKELEYRISVHFNRPPAARDPRDEKKIKLLRETIELDDKKLKLLRTELRVPSRIIVLEKSWER